MSGMWSTPRRGPHQDMSGICSTPKYVRSLFHTKECSACGVCVPHQYMSDMCSTPTMSGMWSIPKYVRPVVHTPPTQVDNVRYVVHTKICPVCGPHQICPACGPHQNMSGMCSTSNMPRGNFRLGKNVRHVVHTKHATWQF